jgi:hypothetical protein
MTQLINLTPHTINIILGNKTYDVPASGTVARCSQTEKVIGTIEVAGAVSIPVTNQSFGDVTDLPEPKDGVFYIVSRLVASACPSRIDLLIPGPMVRDDDGKVIGCRGLSRI